MSKLARVQEKTQIKWATQLFQLFIIFATEGKSLSSSQKETLEKELDELAEAAMGEDPPESIAEQLNHYIGMVNAQMKQQTEAAHYTPFPLFSCAVGEHILSAALDQLDMVERTLTEAGQAGMIDWNKESDYFAQVLQIFSQVESRKMLPQEGMARLAGVLEKVNNTLSPKFALPLPDINAYE